MALASDKHLTRSLRSALGKGHADEVIAAINLATSELEGNGQFDNMQIDDGGYFRVGHTAQLTVSTGDGATDLAPQSQIVGTGQADSSVLMAAFSATATRAAAPTIALVKGGAATVAAGTVVTSGEILGSIIAYGDDGTDLESPAAGIEFACDGTPGTGDMPGRIVFYTTTDAGETLTERLRIDNGGDFTIADTSNFILNTTTGTEIGTAVGQKLGFWAATPIVQPASGDQADQGAMTFAAGSIDTGTDMTAAQAAALVADIAALDTLLTAVRTALVNAGIMKGAA